MTLKVALLLVSIAAAEAQDSFQNLNFEAATLSSSVGGNEVPATSALPGWSVYFGSTQQSQVLQNDAALNDPRVDILGPNNSSSIAFPPGAPGFIDGSFSVVLQGGVAFNPNIYLESASIEQTGTIPAGDESLQFKAWASASTPPSEWSVSFAGHTLSVFALTTTSQYTLYGADVSTYSGQTGLLEFTDAGQGGPSFLELDDITFSTQSAPEPSPAILVGLGGVMFALRGRFKR